MGCLRATRVMHPFKNARGFPALQTVDIQRQHFAISPVKSGHHLSSQWTFETTK
jgi:hypothetical protein